MILSRRSCFAMLGLVAIALGGCVLHKEMPYNKLYMDFASSRMPTLFRGKAIVVTTKEADQVITGSRPISGGGSMVSYDLKSGEYCRDSALAMFGKVFEDGSEHSNAIPDRHPVQAVIIEPRVLDFQHKYVVISWANGRSRAEARVRLNVTIRLSDGRVFEKQYESGFVSMESSSGFGPDDPPRAGMYVVMTHAFAVALEMCIKDMESFVPMVSRPK